MERITRGFLQEPSSDSTPMTLAVLRNFKSAEMDSTAVALVEGLLLRDSVPYWTAQAIALVFRRFGDSDAVRRLRSPAKENEDPVFNFRFSSTDGGSLNQIWASGVRELGIPDLEPLLLRDERMEGVGPLTLP